MYCYVLSSENLVLLYLIHGYFIMVVRNRGSLFNLSSVKYYILQHHYLLFLLTLFYLILTSDKLLKLQNIYILSFLYFIINLDITLITSTYIITLYFSKHETLLIHGYQIFSFT